MTKKIKIIFYYYKYNFIFIINNLFDSNFFFDMKYIKLYLYYLYNIYAKSKFNLKNLNKNNKINVTKRT